MISMDIEYIKENYIFEKLNENHESAKYEFKFNTFDNL